MADLTASGSTPAVIWDVDATSNDWRMIADASTMSLDRYSGSWSPRFVWSSAGGLTVYGNSASYLTFDAPSDDDFQFSNDGAGQFFLKVNTGSGYQEVCQWNENLSTSKVSIKIASLDPSLTFEDQTSGDDDFRLRANADVLKVEVDTGSGFSSLFEWTSSEVRSNQSVKITNADPSLTLNDTSSSAVSYRLRCESNIFFVENDSGSPGTFAAGGLEIDSSDYVHATKGLISGHDAAGGTSHAICWKRSSLTLSSTDVTNGYFTHTITDQNPAEWSAKTIGVMVMMSDSDTATSTFQVSSWRSSSASGSFSVQLLYGGGTGGGDMVKVTFDNSFYGSGDRWHILVFYTP